MGAGHSHGSADTRASRMIMASAILGVFFVELTTALIIGSLALLADATRTCSPTWVALFMGLTAVLLARRGSKSAARTYGWHRAEVFTAVANAGPAAGRGGLHRLRGAIKRLGEPPQVPGWPMILVALLALLANVAVVLLLRSHSESSLAVKGAYMPVMADAVSSVGRADRRHRDGDDALAVCRHRGGGAGGAVVLPGPSHWPARAAHPVGVLPKHIDVDELRSALAAVDGVTEVHDLHVWTRAGQGHGDRTWRPTARPTGCSRTHRRSLAERGLGHATVQVEPPGSAGTARLRRTLSQVEFGGRPDRSRRADPGSARTRRSRRWSRRRGPARRRSAGSPGSARGE